MLALIFGYWFDTNYTFDHGVWLIPVCIAPGLLIGIISALSVQMVSVHESGLSYLFCLLRIYFDLIKNPALMIEYPHTTDWPP